MASAVWVGHDRDALRVLSMGSVSWCSSLIDHPSPPLGVLVTVLVLIALAVIEVLGRAAPPTPSAPEPA